MERRTRIIGLFLGVALFGAAPVSALAEDIVLKGVLNAMSILPLDAKRPVKVKLYDDSETSLAMKSAFESALSASGYQVSEDATLTLTFELQNSVNTSTVDDPGRVEIVGHSGGYSQAEEYTARVELFNSQEKERGVATTQGALRLDVALTDRQNGRRLWQGWANADSTAHSERDVGVQLVTPLVHSLGKTLRNQPLSSVQ